MWELVQVGNTDWSVIFKSPRTFTVGRTESDILIPDKSISRKHAILKVTKQASELCFTLLDQSKFGTLVNGTSLSGGSCQLKSGDNIKFGAQPGVDFLLQRKSFKVATSSMSKSIKQRLKTAVELLHGEVVSDFSESCNFLIMPALVVTTKVICALLAQVPIVTPAYLEKYVEASSRIPFIRPNPMEYLPPIKEDRFTDEDLFRFQSNHTRRTLFKNKTFYVLTSEQFSQLQTIVLLGGGEIWLIDSVQSLASVFEKKHPEAFPSRPDEYLHRLLSHPTACLIHAKPNIESRDWQRTVYTVLRAIHRRPILESELGFATIYVSTEAYCNPDKKCPDKLYQEASISQAFSINPFHLDSQPHDMVLKEQSVNLPLPATVSKRVSIKRSRPIEEPTSSTANDVPTNRFVEPAGPKVKRPRAITQIVPPAQPKLPEIRRVCLVPDSEAAVGTSPNFQTRFPHDSDHHRSSTCKARAQAPVSDAIVKTPPAGSQAKNSDFAVTSCRDLVSAKDNRNNSTASNNTVDNEEHTDAEVGLLAALDSMPALMATLIPSLSSNLPAQSESTKELANHTFPVPCSYPSQQTRSHTGIQSPEPTPTVVAVRSPVLKTKPSSSLNNVEVKPYQCDSSHIWSSKKEDVTSNSVTETGQLPVNCAKVEFVSLVVQPAECVHRCAQILPTVNYKRFKKVWPTHMQAFEPPTDTAQLVAPRTVIELVAYTSQVDDALVVSATSASGRTAEDEERERINRLFEKMCEMPRGRI